MSNDTFYAYGSEHAEIETVMRFHAVKRWHMIDTTRQQTLAEHSANVGLLAYIIAVNAPQMYFGSADRMPALALIHDLPETFTGDTPSHTKQFISGLDELEQRVLPRVFDLFSSPDQKTLIKLCDFADGIRFIRLHGVDITARHAKEGLEKKYEDRIDTLENIWPEEVLSHVVKLLTFYMYEMS